MSSSPRRRMELAGHVANAFEDDEGYIELRMAYATAKYLLTAGSQIQTERGPGESEMEARFANLVLDFQSDAGRANRLRGQRHV